MDQEVLQQPPTGTCVIVPAYNEAMVIDGVVAGLRSAGYAVIVVDDGSTDDTSAVALAAGASVVSHPLNLGQGAALQTGIDYAVARSAEIIVTFDGDGQHRIADVARLCAAWTASYRGATASSGRSR